MTGKKIFLFLLVFASSLTFAQTEFDLDSLKAILIASGIAEDTLDDALKNLYESSLNDAETINQSVKEIFLDEKPWALLNGLSVSLKTFQSVTPESANALGFSYEYQKDMQRYFLEKEGTTTSGISLSLSANGNVAFIEELNPNNFLSSKAAIHFFRSWGGALRVDEQTATLLNQIEDELVLLDDVDGSTLWNSFLAVAVSHLTTQIYVDLSLTGGLESNQSFTKKNYTLGGRLGFDLKAWNDNSLLAKWNIFDYPFAVIRFLTATEDDFIPYGSSFPTILIGYSLINPVKDKLRRALGEEDSYGRIDFELGFKTILVKMDEKPVFFEASLIYFLQPGASKQIKESGLNEFILFNTALKLPHGIYFAYTTGKLPFDVTHDKVYSLGFELMF
ncbi:MAG: hypothetical protein GW789_13795 [Ignavibacteria bacterium]|nr:hypothetical protein [Ignavibacteria bacterium]